MDPVTLLGPKFLTALASAGAKRLQVAVLGGEQQRALEVAVRKSGEAVAARHADLAAISAEIDLMSANAVVDELVAAATGDRSVDWAAVEGRWRLLYQTDPDADLRPLLMDLAGELSRRLRGDPKLQDVYVVSAAALLVDQQAEMIDKVSLLSENVAAQLDPVRAVRARGDEVERDLGLVTNIFGQVGQEMSRGLLRAIDLDVSLTESGTSFRVKPKAGADVRVNVTVRAEDTPEGRARIAALKTAAARNEPFDMAGAQVAFEADGVPYPLPGRMDASAGPASVRHHAVIEFRSNGRLPAERFFVDLDIQRVNGKLRAESPSHAMNLLRATFEDAGGDALAFKFSGNPDVATVRTQLKMARLGQHLKRGAKVTLWFVEMDLVRTTTMPANAAYEPSDRDYETLKLFEEVQRRVGAEVSVIEELTPADVADLRMAKRLLDIGATTLAGRGGTFTTTTGDDIRLNVPPSDVRRGRVRLRTIEPEWRLPLSRHPLALGPVATMFTVFWPPKTVRRRADGSFVSEMEIDPARPVRLERVPADQAPDKSVTKVAQTPDELAAGNRGRRGRRPRSSHH